MRYAAVSLCLAFAAPAVAQTPPPAPLISQPLPAMQGDLDVQMIRLVVPPAGDGPVTTVGKAPHAHPGGTYAYVIRGEVVSRLGAGDERHYRAGEAWAEVPGEAHALVNASRTEPAEVLVVFVLPRGAPATGPVR